MTRSVTVRPTQRRRVPWLLLNLFAVAAVFTVFLLFYDIPGSVEFALRRRSVMVISLVLVAAASAVSTVVFHTITDNRLLTPSIMGFDALFVLVQTALVFFLGTDALGFISGVPKFLLETALMVTFATLLFGWLFSGRRNNLYALLLVGVVFGVMFQSVSVLMQRLLAPNEFNFLLSRTMASFSKATPELLPWAAVGLIITIGLVWMRRRRLDVIALGRDTAIGLGVNHKREVTLMLVLISVMVAISTALVGPLTFFGFMIATLAYQLSPSSRHAQTLPMAFALGLVALTAGQFVLDELVNAGSLSILIEFVGGILFLVFLLRRKNRT